MSPPEDPRALARRLAAEARQRAAKASRVEALAQKAPPKPMSAQEALEAAIAAEQAAAQPAPKARRTPPDPHAEDEAQRALARAEAAKARATRPAPRPESPSRPPTSSGPRLSPASLIEQRLPSLRIERILTIERREAFRATWAAHRSRASVQQDPSLLATADRLVLAAQQLPSGQLHAAHLIDASGTSWAVFIDGTTRTLLAALSPAETYLAGSSS